RGDIAGLAQPVLGVGGGAGAVGIDLGESASPLPGRIGDAGQRRFDQIAAGGAAGRQVLGKARYGRHGGLARLRRDDAADNFTAPPGWQSAPAAGRAGSDPVRRPVPWMTGFAASQGTPTWLWCWTPISSPRRRTRSTPHRRLAR